MSLIGSEIQGSDWLSYKEIRLKLLEPFDEQRYESLIQAFERLLSHPYSKLAKDFIEEYRKEIQSVTSQMKIPPLMTDENGRPYMTAKGLIFFRFYSICFISVLFKVHENIVSQK